MRNIQIFSTLRANEEKGDISMKHSYLAEGTLVFTDRGYVPIQDLTMQDHVLDHKGTYKKIQKISVKESKTYLMKGSHYGLEHSSLYLYDTFMYSKNKIEYSVPCMFEYIPIPYRCIENKREKPMPFLNEKFFYFLGMWVNKGWVSIFQRKNRPIGNYHARINICDSTNREKNMIEAIDNIVDNYYVHRQNNNTRICFNSTVLAKWLKENFGEKAENRTIPSWIYSLPKNLLNAFFDGFIEKNNITTSKTFRISTVSKQLAESIRILGNMFSYNVAVYNYSGSQRHKGYKNPKDYYIIHFNKYGLHSNKYKVSGFIPTDTEKKVYAIDTESNTFVADGVLVKNIA